MIKNQVKSRLVEIFLISFRKNVKPETHRARFDARLAQLRQNATENIFRNRKILLMYTHQRR